jgi:hypothetical protein
VAEEVRVMRQKRSEGGGCRDLNEEAEEVRLRRQIMSE